MALTEKAGVRRLVAALIVFALVAVLVPNLGSQPGAAQQEPQLGDPPVYTGEQAALNDANAEVRIASVAAVDTSNRAAVVSFFNSNYLNAPKPDPEWAGDVVNCVGGTTSTAYKAAILQRINVFRSLAGLPNATAMSSTFSAKAQKHAVMTSKASALSHNPGPSWPCYTADGAEAASKSNIFTGVYGWEAIDGYIWDWGTFNTAVGHRRWILYPQTTTFGTGDIPRSWQVYPYGANTLWVFDGNFSAPRPQVRDEFVAWPPKGFVPYQIVYPRWSLSYPNADFSGATVSMTSGGKTVPVTVESKDDIGYGENTIVWVPSGLNFPSTKPSKDTTYSVTVSNVRIGGSPRNFTYKVTVIDPASAPPPTPTPLPGPACSLDKSSGQVQAFLTVSCSRFASGEQVNIHWDSTANKIRGTMTADSSGNASMTIRVPDSTFGRHWAIANGASSGSTRQAFTVVPKLSLSPIGGEAGIPVTVTLRGYKANESVTIWVESSANTRIRVLTNVMTGASGRAVATFTMPVAPAGKRPVIGIGSLGSEARRNFQLIVGTAEVIEPTSTPSAVPTLEPTATATPVPAEPTAVQVTETPVPEPTAPPAVTEPPSTEPTTSPESTLLSPEATTET